MEWRNLSLEKKVEMLGQQVEDIKRAKDLLDRFEQLTQKWLKRVEAPKKSK
jgi:hypothetical protein